MREMRNASSTLVGKPEGQRPLEDLGVNEIRTGLRETGWVWSGLIWLRIGTSGEPL
jgi:hypothetical protein